jgi:hypothetical protein
LATFAGRSSPESSESSSAAAEEAAAEDEEGLGCFAAPLRAPSCAAAAPLVGCPLVG